MVNTSRQMISFSIFYVGNRPDAFFVVGCKEICKNTSEGQVHVVYLGVKPFVFWV